VQHPCMLSRSQPFRSFLVVYLGCLVVNIVMHDLGNRILRLHCALDQGRMRYRATPRRLSKPTGIVLSLVMSIAQNQQEQLT
jgi:hypothetical protein